jgi:hypothetical protein
MHYAAEACRSLLPTETSIRTRLSVHACSGVHMYARGPRLVFGVAAWSCELILLVGYLSQTQHLLSTDEDLESFQSTLPRPQAHTPPVSQAQANFQQARHFAQITIEISVACRLVHAALTGPRARQRYVIFARELWLASDFPVRMGEAHVDETILTRGWDMLDTCWHKLDSLRTQYGHIHAQMEEVDLFASGWQVCSLLS